MTVKFAGNNVIALFKVSMCMSNRSFMFFCWVEFEQR